MLWCAVDITCDDPELDAQLAFLDHAAVQSVAPTTELRLRATRVGDDYRLERDGSPAGVVESAQEVVLEFFRTAYVTAFDALPSDAIVFHGVTVAAGRDRVLLVAPSGSGKSTLAVHLAGRGVDVLGDEYAVLLDGELTALPRRFHLKPGGIERLSDLQAVLDASPRAEDSLGQWARSFDPADVGRPRVMTPGPIRAAIAIEPNHGGTSALHDLAQIEMARRLIEQTFTPVAPSGAWIARVCDALRDATTHRLVLGDLNAAFIALGPVLG